MYYDAKLSKFASKLGYALLYEKWYRVVDGKKFRCYTFLQNGVPVLERVDGDLEMIVPTSKKQAELYIKNKHL